MSLWMEHLNELSHYHDLRREADQERLARLALVAPTVLARRPKIQEVWRRGLSWLGARLSAWGAQLQDRYGTALPPLPELEFRKG